MFLVSTIAYDFIECITRPDQSGNLHKNPPVCRDRRSSKFTGSPQRRLTSVHDLDNQVGTGVTRFKFPGACPVYCHETVWFPFMNRQRSLNFIGSHQRRSRACSNIVALYLRMTNVSKFF